MQYFEQLQKTNPQVASSEQNQFELVEQAEEPAQNVSLLRSQLTQQNQLNQITQLGLLNPVTDVYGACSQWNTMPFGCNMFYWY